MTKQDALEKIKELQAYVEGLDGEFPQEDDTYWYINSRGDVLEGFYDPTCFYDENRKDFGNMFQTEKEAKKYALRIKSMKPGWKPEKGERYWTVDFHAYGTYLKPSVWECDEADNARYLHGRVFESSTEAEDWIDTYAEAWSLEDNE